LSFAGAFTSGILVILTPLTSMAREITTGLSTLTGLAGNLLPISITSSAPTGAPPGNKGVVFQVSGGVITIWVWDGSAWRSK
jgi:hypothetical protein